MIVGKKINDDEILKLYEMENNGIKDVDYNILKKHLKKRKAKYYVELTFSEVLKIIMPHHQFCNSKLKLTFKGFIWKHFGGLTLKKVIQKFDDKYKNNYPICWEKVEVQSNLQNNTTIFLSKGKPSTFDLNYFPFHNKKNELYLLDGFHRLVSIGMKKTRIKKYKFILMDYQSK